jgi:hypothetical protein
MCRPRRKCCQRSYRLINRHSSRRRSPKRGRGVFRSRLSTRIGRRPLRAGAVPLLSDHRSRPVASLIWVPADAIWRARCAARTREQDHPPHADAA